jgi:uncharacterized protein YecT (DUF1311 family)
MSLTSSKKKLAIGISVGIGIGITLFLVWQLFVIIYEYRVGIITTAIAISGLLGLILFFGAFPSSDGRFKTGYKDNAEFDFGSFITGLILMGIAFALSLLLSSFNTSKNENDANASVAQEKVVLPATEEPVVVPNQEQEDKDASIYDSSVSKLSDQEYLSLKNISPEYASSDAELGKAFSAMRKTLTPEQKEQLKTDEMNWIELRDQKLQSSGEKGSQEYINALIAATQERTEFLKNYQPQ